MGGVLVRLRWWVMDGVVGLGGDYEVRDKGENADYGPEDRGDAMAKDSARHGVP